MRRIAHDLPRNIQGEEADGLAVRRRFAELVAADDATGAADVLDDDGGIAGNVVRQMQRNDAAFEIGRAAGRIVDDHRDRLALVELGIGALREHRGQRHQSGRQQISVP